MDTGHDVKPRLAEVASRLSSKEVPCIFCKKLWESRLTIINDKKDILGALDALGVKYEPIPGVMDYACYKCVYRINVIIDFRRLLERNVNKSRANYYYAQGNKDMCRKFLLSNDANISNTANSTSSDTLNLLITDVRSEREPEHTADFLFDCFYDPDMYPSHYTQDHDGNPINTSSRLLEPLYEQEFAESGGAQQSANKYKNYNNINDNKYIYKCQYCTKTYKRVHYLKKHERKHRIKLTRRNSTRSAGTVAAHSYKCERCHESFEKRALLKNHEKSHKNRIKCSYCTAEFFLLHDLDLHEATCYGEFCARDDEESVRTHLTRSRTKFQRSRKQSEQVSDSELDTLYSERMRNVDYWVGNVDTDYSSEEESKHDDDRMSVSSYAPSVMSTFSRVSTAISDSSYTGTERSSVISAQVHQRVDYEKPILKRKLITTKSSVCGGDTKRTRSGFQREEHLKQLDDYIISKGDENIYSSPSWQRIRNKAKRRSKAMKDDEGNRKPIYFCQHVKCYYFNEDLISIMEHDVEVHGQLPLYSCKQCQLRFTRPNYLQCHKMEHTAQHHACHHCNESFEYLHQLKYHFELHAIRSYKCPLCSRSFLRQKELDQHMNDTPHLNTDVKMIHYNLFNDNGHMSDDESHMESSYEDRNDRNCDTYTVFTRPQEEYLVRRPKYEKVRWRFGSDLAYPAGINQLTIELNSADNTPVIRGEADEEIPIGPAAIINKNQPETEARPAEDISEIVQENIEQRPESPIDLDSFNLFSIDILEAKEVINHHSRTKSVEKDDEITLSKRTVNGCTMSHPKSDNGLDSPLPSYAALTELQSENSRLRILPLMNSSLPSRLPC